MESYRLTKNQIRIFEAVEYTHNNIMVTGKPGVGKSVLIRSLMEEGNKTYTLCAPTGLAAMNIGGRTLHSLFKLPVSSGIVDETYNVFPHDQNIINNLRYNVKHLIIDEISMVRADYFDYMDRLLKHVKQSVKPFGGIQIIIIGDFYQLPPVVNREEVKPLYAAGYTSAFVFASKAFQNNFKHMELNEVLRQKGDPNFLKLLDSARTGNVSFLQCKTLNKQVGLPKDLRIRLTCKNAEAQLINDKEMAKLPGESKVFHAESFGEWPHDPVEKELFLKVGAQVIVKMNYADKPPGASPKFISNVMNGTIGVVKEINNERVYDPDELNDSNEDEFVPNVTITLENGSHVTIYRKRWERKIKKRVEQDGKLKWEEVTVASFEQMPLSLAWAISIHKSQGQSFHKVHIDARSVFAPGQLYVALSRCRTLKGISFEVPLTTNKFWANLDVLEFFDHYETVK